jgi:hypothetical protein
MKSRVWPGIRSSGVRLFVCLAGAAVGLGVAAAPQDQAAATVARELPPLVSAASKYVAGYSQKFSGLACEETTEQVLYRGSGGVRQRRTIVADLTFVKLGNNWMQTVFRDVLSVDGRKIRDREDRLAKLFLSNFSSKSALEQAMAIGRESNRYNLGINRMGVSPLLPLSFLDAHIVGRLTVAIDGRRLRFDEPASPTFLSFTKDRRRYDLPANGTFEFDAGTGEVRAAKIRAADPKGRLAAEFDVTYAPSRELGMLLPKEMLETNSQPGNLQADRLQSHSTYSNFRRFEVVVSETIK